VMVAANQLISPTFSRTRIVYLRFPSLIPLTKSLQMDPFLRKNLEYRNGKSNAQGCADRTLGSALSTVKPHGLFFHVPEC
jgi:hypothetical protein